jgi:diguanylate cyclase (GGDEF)-like protein
MAKSALAEQSLPATHILLVEDNPSDAFLIGRLLGEHGLPPCKTHYVKNQSEAIRALDERAFDVCLLDLTLPDAAGFSALITIQEKAPDMPILILTGTNDTSLAKRAVGRGAQDYLLKDEMETAALGRSIDYAMERKHVEKGLFQRANYDALTGLANRSLFESRLKLALARTERTGSGIAVLFIDLDRFKPINDTYGHETGDDVLKTVAQRLKSVLRAYDTAARLGGDEFAALLEGIASPRDAATIVRKIIKALAPPMLHHGKNLKISASIGIMFSDTPASPEAMLKNADAAMYQAKKEGGNSYHFHAPDIHGKADARFKIEKEIRTALSARQLRLHYQPYIAPDGEAILGVEVLLRWAHPARGLLRPDEFLGVAEESRLMPEIGEWMFSELRRDIALWNGHAVPPLEIAFNVCASQLDAPGFIDWVAPLAQEKLLGHHRLVAEIDADALAPLSESRLLLLTKLREAGILLHLDHFGRGPVSLQLLHTFPFSLLKLDLSLMARMSDGSQGDALIRTAIELAHQLGMKAGAVGVEMPWQMQTLKAQRCDMLQGFLIGRPMTADQLLKWLANRTAARTRNVI